MFGSTNTGTGAFSASFGPSQQPKTTSSPGFGGFSLPSTTTGMFGGQSTQPAAGAAPLTFGSAAQPTSGFSMASTQPQISTGMGFSFGASQPATTNPFGGTTTTPAAGTGFSLGGSQPSMFGSTSNTLGAQSFSTMQSQQNMNPFGGQSNQYFGLGAPALPEQNLGPFAEPIKEIKKRYAPYLDRNGYPQPQAVDAFSRSNEECKFSSVVYKKYSEVNLSSNQLQNLPRSDEIDRSNPNPSQYFPMKEFGVKSLHDRFERQTTTLEKYFEHTKEVRAITDSIDKNANLLSARLDGLRNSFVRSKLQLLQILHKIEVLRSHGTSLQASEIKYRESLEKLTLAIRNPSRKLKEILMLESQLERKPETLVQNVSDDDLEKLYNLLMKQMSGIEVLAEVLKYVSSSLAYFHE